MTKPKSAKKSHSKASKKTKPKTVAPKAPAQKLPPIPKIDVMDTLRKAGLFIEEPTENVIHILEKHRAIPEEKIAEIMKVKVNAVRRLLYDLMEKGVTRYEKKKDEKKKWWYLYFWSLDYERISGLIKAAKLKHLDRLKKQLEEEKRFEFECRACSKKFLHEEALESEYLCPDCGSALEQARQTTAVKKIEIEIRKVEKELLDIDILAENVAVSTITHR